LIFPTTLLLLAASSPQPPATTAFQDRVEVVASRVPEGGVARRVVVLTREEIARLPVTSISEVVAWLTGTGVSQRGAYGVQADLGLRGATFEQVAVLVNGVRVNDPQTGHFHLDVPFPLEAVDRISVLLGPGSSVHGPDAFGGVVEITTGSPAAPRVRLAAGEHSLLDARVATPVGAGGWAAVSRTTSQGYRPDTEFAISRAALGWSGHAAGMDVRVDAAAEGKQFGAWAFYSQAFPNQRERTTSAVGTLVASRNLGDVGLTVRAGARQHRDVFLLDRDRPDWYRNRHRTRGALLQATLAGAAGAVSWSAGVEAQRELIASSRLGSHDRDRGAAFAETAWSRRRWTFSLQARADHVVGLGWEGAPALGLSLEVGHGLVLSYHRGRSFRLPSFTDLYYVSPGTVGDPQLAAETAWSDELLLRSTPGRWGWELAAFRRDARDVIDYLRDDAGVYRATNHAAVTTVGVEAAAVARDLGPLSALRVAATWLDSDLDVDPTRSRYALAHPRWELSGRAAARLPLGLDATAGIRYRAPQRGGGYAVVDLRLARALTSGLELTLEATNLLDRSYEEIPGVPMPPRWITVGLNWRGDGS